MKTVLKVISFSTLILVVLSACSKKKDAVATPSVQGGTGGNFTIAIFVKHHDRPINHARVFLKYADSEFIADTNKYDERKTTVSEPGENPHIHFMGLKAGTYYFYARAYDSLATNVSKIVKGGRSIVISATSPLSMDTTLAVSEE